MHTESVRADELAALLTAHPVVVERLLAEHIDDGSGRCTVCAQADQTARSRFPCRLRLLADDARARLDPRR